MYIGHGWRREKGRCTFTVEMNESLLYRETEAQATRMTCSGLNPSPSFSKSLGKTWHGNGIQIIRGLFQVGSTPVGDASASDVHLPRADVPALALTHTGSVLRPSGPAAAFRSLPLDTVEGDDPTL